MEKGTNVACDGHAPSHNSIQPVVPPLGVGRGPDPRRKGDPMPLSVGMLQHCPPSPRLRAMGRVTESPGALRPSNLKGSKGKPPQCLRRLKARAPPCGRESSHTALQKPPVLLREVAVCLLLRQMRAQRCLTLPRASLSVCSAHSSSPQRPAPKFVKATAEAKAESCDWGLGVGDCIEM
ncbi:uncharacterized protein LOC144456825 [Phascolarctos cinereus]